MMLQQTSLANQITGGGEQSVDSTQKMIVASIILSVLSILINLLASEHFQKFLASLTG